MSAVAVTIAALRLDIGVKFWVFDRITNMVSQEALPNILIHLIHETDDFADLDGPGRIYTSRVSVECRSENPAEVHVIAEAVKNALEPIHLAEYAGCECSFWKEGTDQTDFGDGSSVSRRTLDFYVSWRRLPPEEVQGQIVQPVDPEADGLRSLQGEVGID